MNIEYFLKQTRIKYCNVEPPEIELYSDIENIDLKLILATMHSRLNNLFYFLYAKASHRSNYYYNAEQSRELLKWITLFRQMKHDLSDTEFAISIDSKYEFMMNQCKSFLIEMNGSSIPEDIEKIDLVENAPIFTINDFIKVTDMHKTRNYKIVQIGSGSYARVFRYKDEFYNKYFAIKRAKVKELCDKEIERFKQEFKVMNDLKSPYVISVFRYDDSLVEYYMEYADETLKQYIDRYNETLDLSKRFEIINQVIKALKYVHSKNYFHRDLSLTNVLLFHYDDVLVVKLSDFGLVKIEDSDLTSVQSDIKGSLNDPSLKDDGFHNYSFAHEVYALTRLILFILTGKTNTQNLDNLKIKDFVLRGTNPNKMLRYRDLDELKDALKPLLDR